MVREPGLACTCLTFLFVDTKVARNDNEGSSSLKVHLELFEGSSTLRSGELICDLRLRINQSAIKIYEVP